MRDLEEREYYEGKVAMPVASFGTMFCMKYGRNPSLMTEITFITTVASILTIPLITLLFG